MKIGTTDITKAYIGANEVSKIYLGTTQIYPAGGGYYNVGTPSFVMRFDGSFDYYSDGNITAQKVGNPTLTTGGAWGNGALAQTYDSNDTSARNALQININKSYWQTIPVPFFIEFWAKIENTAQNIYQCFLGNMEHPNTTYNGWSYRWGTTYSALDFICSNNSSLSHSYTLLNDTQKSAWQTACGSGNWAHYGIYIVPGSGSTTPADGWFMANGKMFELTGSWFDSVVGGGENNILIGNAKYGTGYTLSPMGEVRILTGQNASDYFAAIKGNYDSTTNLYAYTVPTGSFADGGLTKYTAS